MNVLEEEWGKQDKVVKELQRQVDKMKVQLGILDDEETSHQRQSETIHRLEALRAEATAEYAQINTLFIVLIFNSSGIWKLNSTCATVFCGG